MIVHAIFTVLVYKVLCRPIRRARDRYMFVFIAVLAVVVQGHTKRVSVNPQHENTLLRVRVDVRTWVAHDAHMTTHDDT